MSLFGATRHFFFWILALAVLSSTIGCGHKKDETATTENQGPGDIATVELVGRDSVSVLDLLREQHDVQFKQSSLGTFVTGIDTLEVTRETYWIYTVNDSTPDLGADRYITSDHDRVVWHYRQAGW